MLKADPDTRVRVPPFFSSQLLNFTKAVFIEDVGSMHGTYVDDLKVIAHERHPVYDDDIVKFGSEVTRGPGTCPFCQQRALP